MHNIAAHSEHKTKLQTLLKLRNIDVNSIARLKRDSTLYKNFAEWLSLVHRFRDMLPTSLHLVNDHAVSGVC